MDSGRGGPHGRRRHDALGAASPSPVPAPFPGETPDWAADLTEGSSLPTHSPYRWSLVADAVLGYGQEGINSVLHARVFEADPLAENTPDAREEVPPPVVILGQFGDHRGQSITNSIEHAAAAAQAKFYPDGQVMRVVLMYPNAVHCLGPLVAPLLLREVRFAARTRRSALQQRWRRRRARREQQRGEQNFTATSVGPDGVTRHVLPTPALDLSEWVFSDGIHGRDLRLEVPAADQSAVVGDPYDRERLRWSRPAAVRVPALLGDTELATWPEELYTAELIGGPEAGVYAAHRYGAIRRRVDAEMGIADAITDPAPDTFTEFGTTRDDTRDDD